MPAPSSEDDLKRRARRRLIGAVALTLVAVIALPLMLEDEPPPAAQLEVKMPANSHTPDFVPLAPAPLPTEPVVTAQAPETVAPISPPVPNAGATKSVPEPAQKTEPAPKPAPPAAVTKAPVPKPKPIEEPEAKKTPQPNLPHQDESQTSVEKNTAFVVQLGAFSNAAKTQELKHQVDELGMQSYTDKAGELTRLRVGPFATRDAAAAAAAKLDAAGLQGRVMPQ